MKNLAIIFFTVIGFQFTGFAQEVWPFPPAGTGTIVSASIMHDGLQRDYLVYLPTIYTGESAVPLILNFHGFTSWHTQQIWYGDFTTIADTENFIIVCPQGTKNNLGLRGWNVPGQLVEENFTADDVGFTEALIDKLASDYNIDLTRVYSTGASNGGFLSQLLACQLGDKIAAIAPVIGGMYDEVIDICNTKPQYPTSVLIINGTMDPRVPYYGNADFLAVDDVMQFWIDNNHTNPTPSVAALPNNEPNDGFFTFEDGYAGSTIEHIVYNRGAKRSSVELLKVIDGGHAWPGAGVQENIFLQLPGTNWDINGSEEIWKFFSRYDINGLIDNSNIEKAASVNVKYYPNPFTETITFSFEAPEYSKVEVKIYDANGNKSSKGLTYSDYSDGKYKVIWNAGDRLVDGFYFFKLFVDGNMIETINSNKIFKN
jgi:polyhydroxybutyrate depolymerase